MSEGKNKNIDSYLDNGIRQSLLNDTSSDFTFELMKRVELEKEFAKEDVKTSRMAKYIIGGFVSLLIAFVVMFAFVLNTNPESKDAGFFNGVVDKFSGIIESISVMITGTLGLVFDSQTSIIILLAMVFVFLFSFADRVIFKKRF